MGLSGRLAQDQRRHGGGQQEPCDDPGRMLHFGSLSILFISLISRYAPAISPTIAPIKVAAGSQPYRLPSQCPAKYPTATPTAISKPVPMNDPQWGDLSPGMGRASARIVLRAKLHDR